MLHVRGLELILFIQVRSWAPPVWRGFISLMIVVFLLHSVCACVCGGASTSTNPPPFVIVVFLFTYLCVCVCLYWTCRGQLHSILPYVKNILKTRVVWG